MDFTADEVESIANFQAYGFLPELVARFTRVIGLDRNAAGEFYLLSNEIGPAGRNLSFEREFGRQIALLDLMATIVADRNGRGISRVGQSAVSTIFLPVGFLK